MRAVRFHRHGRPTEVLQVDAVPTPDPGPGEVRLRLTHRPIHPADLSAVRGTYGALRDLPATGGNEGVGVIDAVGPDVDGLAVGQRAVKLGAAPTWAEAVVLRAGDVLPVPDALDDATAAQLFVNPLTAWLLLDAVPALTSGDTVVQTAGASTVARCVAALAARRGVRSVHVVRDDAHADAIAAVGGTVVVADGDDPEARARLAEAVGPGGARAVFDAVAGATGAGALSALGDGGTHVVYGALSGQPLPVTPAALLYRAATVRGVWRTRWARETDPAVSHRLLREIASLAVEGVFPLPVDATFDLGDIREAVAAATRRGRLGKVLLVG